MFQLTATVIVPSAPRKRRHCQRCRFPGRSRIALARSTRHRQSEGDADPRDRRGEGPDSAGSNGRVLHRGTLGRGCPPTSPVHRRTAVPKKPDLLPDRNEECRQSSPTSGPSAQDLHQQMSFARRILRQNCITQTRSPATSPARCPLDRRCRTAASPLRVPGAGSDRERFPGGARGLGVASRLSSWVQPMGRRSRPDVPEPPLR